MKQTAGKILTLIVAVLTLGVLLTGCAPLAADGAGAGAGSTTTTMITTVGLVAVFYFLLLRPERKKKKQLEEMRSSLGPGSEIVTIGGIRGKIVHATEEKLVIETGEDRVRIEITKWAVSSKV